MAEKYLELYKQFLNYIHTDNYEKLYEMMDPNFHLEIKGVPAFAGSYNLQKFKDFNKKLHAALQGGWKAKLHELLIEEKKAAAHFQHEFTYNGKRLAFDGILFLELNREGTKILKMESILSAPLEFFAFAEALKKAA